MCSKNSFKLKRRFPQMTSDSACIKAEFPHSLPYDPWQK